MFKMDSARSHARGSDINGMKNNVHRWIDKTKYPVTFDTKTSRHLCGYRNETTGYLLCPAELDWNDAQYGFSFLPVLFSLVIRVRANLKGNKKMKPTDFPKFLWKDETMNPDNMFDGFMRGSILVKV